MLDEIRELFAYHRWANQRFLAAASALTPEQLSRDLGSSFPSVLATLAHVLSAEWIWLERWHGRSPSARTPADWDLSDRDELRRRWAEVEGAQAEFIQGLTEEELRRVLDYRTLAGDPFSSALWQILRHLVNHATYHRGQVSTMLRQLGTSAPATDLVLYYRDAGGA
jgi:uncharacterized damage-inducible protein DinB